MLNAKLNNKVHIHNYAKLFFGLHAADPFACKSNIFVARNIPANTNWINIKFTPGECHRLGVKSVGTALTL